jgi:hypothetical protein
MFPLARCLLMVLAVCLGGCHNPARQNVPQASSEPLEDQWRKELVPGVNVDPALAYLLTHGFDCRVTRDDASHVSKIVASRPGILLKEASGGSRNGQIEMAIQEDVIQAVKLTPLSASR